MKKIIALVLATMMMAACFVGCGKKESKSDLEYVKEKGKLVVGITEFAPMDYKDEDGNWIGFDADMAKAFGKYLGVDVEFTVLADWGKKALELNNKGIDVAWNGMTITDEVKGSMSVSNAYCNNAQVVVVKADVADKYKTKESLKDLKFAVESGSAGEKLVKELGYQNTALTYQTDALNEVKAGTANACVIDLLMAATMTGEGTSYENLTYTVSLADEQYGVGFRKESDITEKFNEFLKKAYDDGTTVKIANKYGIKDAVIAQ